MTSFLVTTPKSPNRTSVCSDCAKDSFIYNGAIREHPVPEFIDPVFAKTSPKRSFPITKNERFGFVAKTAWVYSGTEIAGCREDTQRQMLLCKQSTLARREEYSPEN